MMIGPTPVIAKNGGQLKGESHIKGKTFDKYYSLR
jgi:hypothetical protein